jgi:hypothetical protein
VLYGNNFRETRDRKRTAIKNINFFDGVYLKTLEPINAVFIVQDRDYNKKLDLVQANLNPPAYVDCTIKAYEGHVQYSMENAYTGNSFFWGLFPHAEDMVTFTFVKPIVIERFVFLI